MQERDTVHMSPERISEKDVKDILVRCTEQRKKSV
eukprot:jgi/Antlo1/1014/494